MDKGRQAQENEKDGNPTRIKPEHAGEPWGPRNSKLQTSLVIGCRWYTKTKDGEEACSETPNTLPSPEQPGESHPALHQTPGALPSGETDPKHLWTEDPRPSRGGGGTMLNTD